MKTKLLIIFLSIFAASNMIGQVPVNNFFNTAIDLNNPPNTGPFNGLVPYNTLTWGKWQASINNSTWNYAMHVDPMNPPPGPSWAGEITTGPAARGWINYAFFNHPNGDPKDHGHLNGLQDIWFRIDFPMGNMPILVLDWDIWSDNKIVDIEVNGTPVWSPSYPSNFASTMSSVNFKWCSGWIPNSMNTIKIHIQSGTPNYIGAPNLNDYSGIMIESKPITAMSISGPSNICPLPVTSNPPFSANVSGATSYVWNYAYAPGFSGPSNGNPINLTAPAGTAPGYIQVAAKNGTACLGAAQKQVKVWPLPIINVFASANPICPGATVALMATGANTYLWTTPLTPSGQQSNALVGLNPGPLVTTQYLVTGTDINGCKNNGQITVNVTPPPNIIITPSSPFLCANNPVVLTANGASNYQWNGPCIVGANNTSNISINCPGTYNVIGTLNGCSASGQITINNGPVVIPSVNNTTLCDNAGTCTMVTVSSVFSGGPITYNWSGSYISGSNIGPSINVCPPLINGASYPYVVTASSPAGCPGTANLAVAITTNCCSQPTTGLTPLTSLTGVSSLANTSYLVESDLVVNNVNTTFQNSELLLMPGVKITVPSGKNLILDHAHLYACGVKMWQGIVVDDGAYIASPNSANPNSMIEDAEVGIELNNISLSHVPQPIDIRGLVFNKNYIGIKISNSDPNLSSLSLFIFESVFTSRNILFTGHNTNSPMSWPSSDVNINGLRFNPAITPTTGLASPYSLQGYAPTTLKWPHLGVPGHIGIKIENIGNLPGSPPSSGVELNPNMVPSASQYNLFDALEAGIDVTDASLTTCNNVFQNMIPGVFGNWFGGVGIYHRISFNNTMNARLDLRPFGIGSQSTDFGNRFWDCWTGVWASNVYEADIEYNVFRSTNFPLNAAGNGWAGVRLESNRFDYNLKYNEFNNLDRNILIEAVSGPYDIAGVVGNGTYAGNMIINENYIGPEVTSNPVPPIAPWSEYSNYAITVNGNNGSNWNIPVGNTFKIISNKIDRAYRGIRVNQMDEYPTEIGGNNIYIIDDRQVDLSGDQYGIYVNDSKDNLIINQNKVKGEGYTGGFANWNKRLKLIRSTKNIGQVSNLSPQILCNTVFDGYIGFEFEGNQPNTKWFGNTMIQKMHKGLSLSNMGSPGDGIGQQGNPMQTCLAYWYDNLSPFSIGNTPPFDTWLPGSTPNWQTYVDGLYGAAPGSFLWCELSTFPNNQIFYPLTNGSVGGANPFSSIPGPFYSLDAVTLVGLNDCLYPPYPATPSQKTMNPIKSGANNTESIRSDWGLEIFPNPSNGEVRITSTLINEQLNLRILDITGKVVYTKSVICNGSETFDISSLKTALYFVEIENESHQVVRKKLVKE